MMLPFRAFQAIESFVDQSTKRIVCCPITINLFDVRSFSKSDPKTDGFNDNKERTMIFFIEKSIIIDVPYQEFEKMMRSFFKDYGMLDDRSLPGPERVSDRVAYRGMMQTDFIQNEREISAVFFKKGYQITDYEDAIFNCLFRNITPLN